MKRSGITDLSSQELSAIYNKLFETSGKLRDSDAFYRWILQKIDLRPPKKLLDVACGEGVLVKFARRLGFESVGVDFSNTGIGIAQKQLGSNIFALANGEALPFECESFDVITNLGSLEHFQNPLVGIQEMLRVLRPDGVAALALPNSYYLVDLVWQVWRTGYSPSHKQPLERFATFREWWDLLEAGGLKVKKAYKYNFCFPRTSFDWAWYRQHPRKLLNLLVAPIVPFNLSNHFIYICSRQKPPLNGVEGQS